MVEGFCAFQHIRTPVHHNLPCGCPGSAALKLFSYNFRALFPGGAGEGLWRSEVPAAAILSGSALQDYSPQHAPRPAGAARQAYSPQDYSPQRAPRPEPPQDGGAQGWLGPGLGLGLGERRRGGGAVPGGGLGLRQAGGRGSGAAGR